MKKGYFGTALEFNNLWDGTLVSPQTLPGLRPKAVVQWPQPIPWDSTIMSRFPIPTTFRVGNYEWYTNEPKKGQLVVVPGEEPENVIFSFPSLVEAPIQLTPSFPLDFTLADWRNAGLDPSCQAPIWTCPDGLDLAVYTYYDSHEYQYWTYHGQRAARYKQMLPMGGNQYTIGQPYNPDIDFFLINCGFALVSLDSKEKQLPSGNYSFKHEVIIIPRSYASDYSGYGPENYCNKNALSHPELLRSTVEVGFFVPGDLVLPEVMQVAPSEVRPGDQIHLHGSRLDHTTRVMFYPGIPAKYRIETESLITVWVPNIPDVNDSIAQSKTLGLFVVETSLGWIVIDDKIKIQRNGLPFLGDGVCF